MAVASCLLAALLIATASVEGRAIQGKLDRQLDIFGVHVGIKYNDPADRTKGGQFHVKVDDMKKIFPRAHSKAVDVNVEFDGGANNRDGLFNFRIDYDLEHSDGDGHEKGYININRQMAGGVWTTKVESKTEPFSAPTIIPKRINNMSWELSSDRQTKLTLSYKNPNMNRDFSINADRVPGKQAHLVIVNGARKHDLTFKVKDFDLKKIDGNFEIGVEGTSLGEAIKGSVKGEANSKGNRIKVEMEKGNKKVVQIDSKIKKNIPALYFETKTKYSLLGGALAGTIKMKFENGQLNLENDLNGEKMELRVKAIPGESLEMEAKKNGVQMWIYKTQRTTTNTPDKLDMELVTDMTLNPDSLVSKWLAQSYPYGTFKVRKNVLKIFVDRQNKNLLFPKFNVDLKLFKEGEQVFDFTADTRAKPYKLYWKAPNVFKRWNINYDHIEATLAHDIGSKLVFNTNVAGGIDIEATRGDNSMGGRDIHILTKKAGKQMMKVDISTEKQITDDQILIKLHDSVEIDPDSALYRRLVKNYRFLTKFQKRTGEFELFVNKKAKNILFSKFYIKGEVKKDGATAMKLLLTTNEKPYKFNLFLPTLLNKIYSDMNEYTMTVDHNPGQLLEVKTNGKKFKGFKIARTGNGNERTIEINGKQLASGDYTLTDNSFSTKITNDNGDWIQPKVTWEGALPKNKQQAEAFLLKNNVKVSATGSKRNFDIDLSWKATKPDWDFSTPESLKLDLNAKGKGPRWGDWSISRDVAASIANKVISFDVSGTSKFSMGRLATSTPILTEVHMKYLIQQRDLTGKMSKVINGKEYSIEFPDGFGVMPQIKMGQ